MMNLYLSKPGKYFVCVLLMLALAGCSSKQLPDSQQMSSPSPSTTSIATNSNFEIPKDFPSVIPVLNGPVVLSSSTGNGSLKTWAVEVIVEDLVAARVETLAKMQSAGFMLQDEQGIGSNDYNAIFVNNEFTVRCKIYLESDTGELEIRYVVTSR